MSSSTFIRTPLVHAGGITHLRRIADLAALYQRACLPVNRLQKEGTLWHW